MNRQSILSLQLLSIFRDKQQGASAELFTLPCLERAGESQVCVLHPVFPVSDDSLQDVDKKKANMVEVTKAVAKRNIKKTNKGVNGALMVTVKPHQCFCEEDF